MSQFTKRVRPRSHEHYMLSLVAQLQNNGRLRHVPGVLRIDASKVVFEHRGVPLRDSVQPIDFARLHRMLVVTFRDLFYAGYVHADLETGGAIMRNVLVDERGDYWLIDFGRMQTVDDVVEEESIYSPETHAAHVIRTLKAYMRR